MHTEELEPSEKIKRLWKRFEFVPNEKQKEAILHYQGPLYLPAGPGSGKTQVLLWRTVNLVVEHGVLPQEIFLSTFTEKAAKQLRDGLSVLLNAASYETRIRYDVGEMYVGTIHSLCRRIITDRRFSRGRQRNKSPALLDELDQYLFIRRRRNWDFLTKLEEGRVVTKEEINSFFGKESESRHEAISNLVKFFNRLSEEMINPYELKRGVVDQNILPLINMYKRYLKLLGTSNNIPYTDLSYLQKVAVDCIVGNQNARRVFKHIIIDEYQDTNRVQEELFFLLAQESKNICVVGDDDQALYRFRGATVENFVEFPKRCEERLGVKYHRVVLSKNYRSCKSIVEAYNSFMVDSYCDWRKEHSDEFYRVMDKEVYSDKNCENPGVAFTSTGNPSVVFNEIAEFVRKLLDAGKVKDPNQIAFLFPSLHSNQVGRMKEALEKKGIRVYAPRANTFLRTEESLEVFGLIFQVFGKPGHYHSGFRNWINDAYNRGNQLMKEDEYLSEFIYQKKNELENSKSDFKLLVDEITKREWKLTDSYSSDLVRPVLGKVEGISSKASVAINSKLFDNFSRKRLESGKPFTIEYAITRATSVDWNVLDLFYQFCGFRALKNKFDLAENGIDEGPISNLSLVSKYLGRYVDEFQGLISGRQILKNITRNTITTYLYILFRRREGEFEDDDDPFPMGRIPFITIHQAKGLEFPVVILANPRKNENHYVFERMISQLIDREGEPLEKMPRFDIMRMFYVALSRARNVLVVGNLCGTGQSIFHPFKNLSETTPELSTLDISEINSSVLSIQEIPETYSYSGDYLLYNKCPRQYMIFKKHGFVPSRSQTMFFGSLVHHTLEDLHQFLINERGRR